MNAKCGKEIPNPMRDFLIVVSKTAPNDLGTPTFILMSGTEGWDVIYNSNIRDGVTKEQISKAVAATLDNIALEFRLQWVKK